jgi:hypothetical protein
MSATPQAMFGQDQAPLQGLKAVVTPPKPPDNSQEPTLDAPEQTDASDKMLAKYGAKLIKLAGQKRDSWQWKRRGIVLKVLTNKEMLKGNHFIGVYPGTYDAFDALEEFNNWTGVSDNSQADRSMDRRPHNFYQMLEKAYVAALSAQIPRSRWKPANADEEEDRETSKVASRVAEIIDRANHRPKMLKQELMEMFTSGCYFKFTRYVVDAARTGTHKQTVLKMTASEVMPARYVCFNCGTTTPENALVGQTQPNAAVGQVTRLACPNCGTPFGPSNFFEDHVEQVPVAQEKTDVANGMVLQSVYGPMHVDADPDAENLDNTPLLNLAQEVSLGWLRSVFTRRWAEFYIGQAAAYGNEQLERQYRDMLTTPAGYAGWFGYNSQNKPTYNRTWIQPMLFHELETEAEALELVKEFPDGCMLAWVGEMPLQLRAAKLTDEWTWNGTEQTGFGLFPKPAGDPAVPVQQRINDCISKIDEYMDRLACGILLANTDVVDDKALNGKAILPGILNPVKFRRGSPSSDIQQAIFQVKGEIDAAIFNYLALLKQDMELLVGTPPQTFGAGTQTGVETKGGQAQQLKTGMQRLGLDWETVCDEHAESDENAIKCAAANMTEDWFMAVSDESEQPYNEYVHLDQMKGSIHAERDTEQGFPMTAAEIRTFWQDILQNAENAFVQELMSVPENVDACIRSIGVPGLVAPRGAQQGKMLRYITLLIKGKPITVPDPVTGEPIQVPSVMPNKYLDDCPTLVKLIPAWADIHWDQIDGNQNAIDNLVAFYKMCVTYEHELTAEVAMTGPPGGPQMKQTAPQPQPTGA